MFNTSFPSGFQSLGQDPYNQVNGIGQVSPYASNSGLGSWDTMSIGNMDMQPPNYMPMAGNDTSSQLYPMENPNAISNYDTAAQPATFAQGGRVKRSMPSVAEMMQRADDIRKHGQREDTVLAHINPEEAQFLAQNFGGDINPHTGLPQFGLFRNPGKWLAGSAGGGAGAIIGNMILPGVGGIIGGALGGAAGSAVRGRKDYGQAAMRGAAMGAAAPTVAGLAGSGANALGMEGLGTSLTNYGNTNAIMPSIGKLMGSNTGMFAPSQGVGSLGGIGQESAGAAQELAPAANKGFMDKLTDDPKTMLALASIAGQVLTKEKPKKEKTAKQLGEDMKAMQLAAMLNPEEITRKEAHDTELARAARRTKRNSYLDEEKLGDLKMVYPKQLSPEESARKGMMIEYYDSPDFKGEPMRFKEGGVVPKRVFLEQETFEVPQGLGKFLGGATKGQDDKIDAKLSDGEYVIDASTVSDLGDGNSAAGASALDKMVKNVRKDKRGNSKLPKKAKPIEKYMR